MDVATLYSLRSSPRPALSDVIRNTISTLKISFKPSFRRQIVRRAPAEEASNWRELAMLAVHRKVREKDDADYDEVNAFLNKLTKQTYDKMMVAIMEKLDKRDSMFRLRVTTLLFDRGIQQTFYAPLMADAYKDIASAYPDARQDLMVQVMMFDTLYAETNVTIVPQHTEAGYAEAIIAWTKQKEKKRTFAVYVSELFARGLIPQELMSAFVKTIMDDLKECVRHQKTPAGEEHVDALVRFVFAVAAKVPEVKDPVRQVLGIPKAETPCLNMKSRFKLDDSLKL
uniref:MIF4G domain-containing protein n=1 Tax=viral metagenome TaxID=1070528 RepID=A0A6C0F3Z4_9ZZZZ